MLMVLAPRRDMFCGIPARGTTAGFRRCGHHRRRGCILPGVARVWREFDTMNQEKAIPISVAGLRAEGYSPDRKSVIISITTKYSSAERKYSVPVDCLYDLIVDLQRLNADADADASIETSIQPADVSGSADQDVNS